MEQQNQSEKSKEERQDGGKEPEELVEKDNDFRETPLEEQFVPIQEEEKNEGEEEGNFGDFGDFGNAEEKVEQQEEQTDDWAWGGENAWGNQDEEGKQEEENDDGFGAFGYFQENSARQEKEEDFGKEDEEKTEVYGEVKEDGILTSDRNLGDDN